MVETASVAIADAGPALWIGRLAEGGLTALLVLMGLWLLWGVVRSITRGRAFDRANTTRLRALAMLLVIGPAMLACVSGTVSAMALNASLAGPDGVQLFALNLNGHLLSMAAGVLCACLAEAFRRGARLEADVEGLV